MDLKNKNKNDLLKILREKKESLRSSRFGVAGSKVRNVKGSKELKKDIARILTKLNKTPKK